MRALIAAVVVALAACSSYRGTARPITPAQLAAEPGWILIKGVPYLAQTGETECGAAAIAMVVSYWTGADPAAIVARLRPVPERGLAAVRLRDHARAQGLASFVIEGTLVDVKRELEAGRPVIVGLGKLQSRREVLDHYEVVVGIHVEGQRIVTLDPAAGWQQNTLTGFAREWKLSEFTTLIIASR